MAEPKVGEEQLGGMLEASRDFAFRMLAEQGRLVPFGAFAGKSGDIEFVRVADEKSDEPVDQIYAKTQELLAKQANDDEILAATSVSHVNIDAETGVMRAIRIHVEAPGFSRIILAPYRVAEAEGKGGKHTLEMEQMIPQDAQPVVFAG